MIRSQQPLPFPKPPNPFPQPFPPQQQHNRRMYSKQLSFPPKQPIKCSSLRKILLNRLDCQFALYYDGHGQKVQRKFLPLLFFFFLI